MRLTCVRAIRRYLNSPFDPMQPVPKQSRWMKRERIFRFTGWQYGDKRDRYRVAIRAAQKIWKHETVKREDAPLLEKYWSQQRVKAACEEHQLEFNHFTQMLRQAKIELNEQMLSNLAIWEPRSFKSLVLLCKQLALEDGRPNLRPEPKPEGVVTRGLLTDGPLPKPVKYKKGPAESFSKPPRKLDPSEY